MRNRLAVMRLAAHEARKARCAEASGTISVSLASW
jgi:hypothetical protein